MNRANPLLAPSRFPIILDYVGYFSMHGACLGAFWTGVRWSDIALCFTLYLVRMFGLMAGYHRYFSHRSFKTSRAVQFLLGLLGSLGYQKGPLWWASHHRYHHRYSDTYLDYHSPVHRPFLYSHSGWFLDANNRQTKFDRVGDLLRYPELIWLDKWSLLPVFFLAVLLLLFFGWRGLIWGFFINTILIWHAIHAIGSFGHRFGGYRRFATTDNSRNKWFLAIALLGEGWHNNHHFYPSSARQGFVWWEIDIAYYILKGMNRVGLIWDLRVPSKQLINGDGRTLQGRSKRFELWLIGLRVGIADRIERAARRDEVIDPQDEFSLQLLKQSLEVRLDDFDANVLELLNHSPEQLKNIFAALRIAMANDVRAFSGRLSRDKVDVLLSLIEDELCRHAIKCPLSHFFLDQEEARALTLPRFA